MENIETLNKRFLYVQELLDKEEFATAIELLDSMFKEYSALDWGGKTMSLLARKVNNSRCYTMCIKTFMLTIS